MFHRTKNYQWSGISERCYRVVPRATKDYNGNVLEVTEDVDTETVITVANGTAITVKIHHYW